MTNERARDWMFGLTPIIQGTALAGIVLFCTFYFAPQQLVLGTRASLVAFATPLVTRFLPYTRRLWDIRPRYYRFLERNLVSLFAASILVAALLILWGVAMFGEIRQRYRYLESIDEAVRLVNAEQISVPKPEQLAIAFKQMPFRPEVPFILARSVRILSPDDNRGPFHKYMKQFVSALDRDAVLAKGLPRSEQAKLSVEASQDLPMLDPVELVVQYSIEVSEANDAASFKWAIATLDGLPAERTNVGLKLYREMLASDYDLNVRHLTGEDRIKSVDESIARIRALIASIVTDGGYANGQLLADQNYQEALDTLGDLTLERLFLTRQMKAERLHLSQNEIANDKCDEAYLTQAVDQFSRMLILRRRLMTNNAVLWWRPPQKLTLFHIFSHLSGQKSTLAKNIADKSAKLCPAAWQALQAMHASPAFRVFQDPEQWTVGTPLALTFNGSAAAAQLRKWLQLGW